MIVTGSTVVEPLLDGMQPIVVCLVGYVNNLKWKNLITNVAIVVTHLQVMDKFSYVMEAFVVLQMLL